MYQAKILANDFNEFYAMIVRIDNDGEQSVIHGYKGRSFKTLKAAERSTSNYIANHCQ